MLTEQMSLRPCSDFTPCTVFPESHWRMDAFHPVKQQAKDQEKQGCRLTQPDTGSRGSLLCAALRTLQGEVNRLSRTISNTHSALGKMGERLNAARCLSLRVREGESNHVTLKTMPKRAKQFKRVLF